MQDSGREKINKVVHWNLWILRDGLKKLEAIASVSQVLFFFCPIGRPGASGSNQRLRTCTVLGRTNFPAECKLCVRTWMLN